MKFRGFFKNFVNAKVKIFLRENTIFQTKTQAFLTKKLTQKFCAVPFWFQPSVCWTWPLPCYYQGINGLAPTSANTSDCEFQISSGTKLQTSQIKTWCEAGVVNKDNTAWQTTSRREDGKQKIIVKHVVFLATINQNALDINFKPLNPLNDMLWHLFVIRVSLCFLQKIPLRLLHSVCFVNSSASMLSIRLEFTYHSAKLFQLGHY